jgi:hypothetical protein
MVALPQWQHFCQGIVTVLYFESRGFEQYVVVSEVSLSVIPELSLKLEAQICHPGGKRLEVPDDKLAVSRTAGDGLHLTPGPGVHPQLIHLQVDGVHE